MKIISHSADADGKLSAFLVAKKFGITDPCDLIMTDYGKHTDWFSQINKNEKVVICDFSFENGPDDMKKLMTKTKDIIWLDHHKSSIDKYGDFGKNIAGLRINGTSAAMLTYLYFYLPKVNEISNEITQEVCEKLYKYTPWVVRYVHDNDVWRYEYGDNTEFFKLGLDSQNIDSPLDARWEQLLNDDAKVNEVINIGRYCKQYRDSLGINACNTYGFEYIINGKKGFCLNNVFGGSPWFVDKINEYDFVCSFNYKGDTKEWEYSFYSRENGGANCIELAQYVNKKGGGHEHAAGCVTKGFLFK